MDSITVKERKATLFLGIIITLVTAVSVFILALTVNGLMGVFLSPSILSGIYVILIYYQLIRFQYDITLIIYQNHVNS